MTFDVVNTFHYKQVKFTCEELCPVISGWSTHFRLEGISIREYLKEPIYEFQGCGIRHEFYRDYHTLQLLYKFYSKLSKSQKNLIKQMIKYFYQLLYYFFLTSPFYLFIVKLWTNMVTLWVHKILDILSLECKFHTTHIDFISLNAKLQHEKKYLFLKLKITINKLPPKVSLMFQ